MLPKKTPHTMLLVLTCLGLAACNDKAPELGSGSTQAAPQQDAAPAPAAQGASELGQWTGNLEDALKTELCALDSINGAVAVDGRFEVSSNQPAVFEGWVSTSNLERPERFTIVLDGQTDFQINASTGVPRDDVASAYEKPALANAGFRAELPALAVPAGDYAINLVHEDNGHTVACASKLTLSAR